MFLIHIHHWGKAVISVYGFLAGVTQNSLKVVSLAESATVFLLAQNARHLEPNVYWLDSADRDEQLALFDALRKNQIGFSCGYGWSPAELFEFYRDQGLLAGEYLRVSWRSPADMRVELA